MKAALSFQLTSPAFTFLIPMLTWIRSTGFFEAPVYMTAATILAVGGFAWFVRKLSQQQRYKIQPRLGRVLRYISDFSLVWLAIAAFFVAFKTMIVEELDYAEPVWFTHYLPTLHFVIAASCAGLLLVIADQYRRKTSSAVMIILKTFIQLALIGGYALCLHRIFTEDLAGAAGGVILLALFCYWQRELYVRHASS